MKAPLQPAKIKLILKKNLSCDLPISFNLASVASLKFLIFVDCSLLRLDISDLTEEVSFLTDEFTSPNFYINLSISELRACELIIACKSFLKSLSSPPKFERTALYSSNS